MNELESEQAQAIAEIRKRDQDEYANNSWPVSGDIGKMYQDRHNLLEIVDSQAQKNEKLLAENNVLSILVDELKADREAQAKKIERLEYQVSEKSDMLTGVAGLHKDACEETERQTQKISDLVAHLRLTTVLHKDAVEKIAEQERKIAIARDLAEKYRDDLCEELGVMPQHAREFYELPWEKL